MAFVTNHRSLERIIVVPRNGYANRLQSWASASILASELNVSLSVVWESQPVATTPARALFSPETVDSAFISTDELTEILGSRHDDIPRYVHLDRARGYVSLAGHDKGEQFFMSDLLALIDSPECPAILVIIAGGLFAPPNLDNFDALRKNFYQQLSWSAALDARVAQALLSHDRFIAAHIRQTDRSNEAPTRHQIRRAIEKLHESTGCDSIFVAADSESARSQWCAWTSEIGLKPWSILNQQRARFDERAGMDALVDWRLLAHSRGMVYTRGSTFGHEAVVAAGVQGASAGIEASRAVQASRRLSVHVRNGLAFARRNITSK